MQDYQDSTSNVIEAALSTDALTGSKAHYNSLKRRVCKLLLLFVGFLVSTLDVGTDWYNYWDATWRIQGGVKDVDSDITTATYMGLFLGVCIFGSVAWVATFSSLVLQCYTICRRHQRLPRLEFFEEMVSMMTLTLQDFPMVALLASSISLRFCPLVEQMRTTPGQVALVSTGVSLVFRMVHSLAFCCSCREKTKQGRATRYMVVVLTVVVRVLRTFLLAVAAVLFMFTVVVSFAPDPNKLPWLRAILDRLDLSGPPNRPIYIYQKYDMPYTVRRHVDRHRSNQVLPPADNFEMWSAMKSQGASDVDCDHYARRIYIGDSIELIKAGPEGLSTTYSCKDANPFFKTSLPGEFQSLLLNHTCHVTFTLVYNPDAVVLAFNSHLTLTPSNPDIGKTTSSCLRMTFVGNEIESKHAAPVISGWPSSVLTSLKNYECEHSFECRTYLSPLFNPYYKPYLSCLGDVCDTSPRAIERDIELREALHQFHYSGYRLVLPPANANFPCLVTRTIERTIMAGMCEVRSSWATGNKPTVTPSTQILSCPESPFGN